MLCISSNYSNFTRVTAAEHQWLWTCVYIITITITIIILSQAIKHQSVSDIAHDYQLAAAISRVCLSPF